MNMDSFKIAGGELSFTIESPESKGQVDVAVKLSAENVEKILADTKFKHEILKRAQTALDALNLTPEELKDGAEKA